MGAPRWWGRCDGHIRGWRRLREGRREYLGRIRRPARTTRETPQGAARAVLRHWNFARDPSEKSSRADRTRQLSLLRTGRRSRAAAGPVVWRRRGPYAVLSAA